MSFSTYFLGDITLQSKKILKNVKIAYKTYGALNDTKDNVILYPTWYSGFISDNEWLIGDGKALDPAKYFIIVVCLFGNGESTSPSNCEKNGWFNMTLYDNVVQQHRLLTEYFQIKKIKLVVGWSMGAMQTFQWACLYPEMVERIAPFCGSARTSPHNYVFLEGPKSTINLNQSSKEYIKSFARVYAGWGFTQKFYKKELYKNLGFNDLEDFLQGFWESFFLKREKENLLALIWTWQHGDVSQNDIFKGDFVKALSSIKAKTLVISPENDLYFPKEDNEEEVKYISDSKLVIIPGDWGHFAGGGLNPEDNKFIDDHLKILLNE